MPYTMTLLRCIGYHVKLLFPKSWLMSSRYEPQPAFSDSSYVLRVRYGARVWYWTVVDIGLFKGPPYSDRATLIWKGHIADQPTLKHAMILKWRIGNAPSLSQNDCAPMFAAGRPHVRLRSPSDMQGHRVGARRWTNVVGFIWSGLRRRLLLRLEHVAQFFHLSLSLSLSLSLFHVLESSRKFCMKLGSEKFS